MQYSPKCKMAMEEVKAVLKKYDLAGVAILADGKGFSEFLNKVDPSWSAAFIQHTAEGQAVRFRVKQKEVGKEKAQELTQDTYRMIEHFADQLGRHSLVYFNLLDMLREHIEIINDDPGNESSHTEQNN
jgi:hypothetical protein